HRLASILVVAMGGVNEGPRLAPERVVQAQDPPSGEMLRLPVGQIADRAVDAYVLIKVATQVYAGRRRDIRRHAPGGIDQRELRQARVERRHLCEPAAAIVARRIAQTDARLID